MGIVKDFTADIAKPMSMYIYVHAYIYLYPAFFSILTYYYGDPYNFLCFYSDTIFIILWGLSYLFVPALLWLIATKILKKIHPIVTMVCFLLFVIMQFMSLGFMIFLYLINDTNEPIF